MGSNLFYLPAETTCDRILIIHKSSVILRSKKLFTSYYLEILTSEVFVCLDEVSASNAASGLAWKSPRSREMHMRGMLLKPEQIPLF
jgi:hypothetical protein